LRDTNALTYLLTYKQTGQRNRQDSGLIA